MRSLLFCVFLLLAEFAFAQTEKISPAPHKDIQFGFGGLTESPLYTIGADWTMQFVYLSNNRTAPRHLPSETHVFIKVVAGHVQVEDTQGSVIHADISPFYRVRHATREMQVSAPGDERVLRVVPGHEAIVAVLTAQDPAMTATHVGELSVRGGEFANAWTRCEEYGWNPHFEGLPFWNLVLFRLWLRDRVVATTQMWAAEPGTNCGFHDHSNQVGSAAFCEIHFALHMGSTVSGMTWVDPKVHTERFLPLHTGHEHAPFWDYDETTGKPAMRGDTSIVYPPHRWLSGGTLKTPMLAAGADLRRTLDIWIAFEMRRAFCTVDP